MKLKELKKNMPMIITRMTYDDLNDQINQAEFSFRKEKDEKNKIQKLKDKEISNLENKIMEKNQLLEDLIKEKEEKSIVILEKEKKIKTLQNKNQELGTTKGNLIKSNNKLKNEIDAKEQAIKEYQLAIEKLESEKQIQADKIKELTSKIEHELVEYQNDGLPKSSKELQNLRKKRRK